MTKQEKITRMVELQKKFIAQEHASGVTVGEYLTPQTGTDLDGYREEYSKLATEVIDDAHKEVGSKR